MALSIILAVLVADQAIVRGAPKFRAYAVAITAASVFAAVAQFRIRHWLGAETLADQPGRDASVRRMQMLHVAADTLT